jgi:hypothetical protein
MAFVKYKNISGYARDRYRADRSNHEKRCTGKPLRPFVFAAISKALFDASSAPLRSMTPLPETNSRCWRPPDHGWLFLRMPG